MSTNETLAWKYAVANQGFTGDLSAWLAMPEDERAEYETGASGVGTPIVRNESVAKSHLRGSRATDTGAP